MEWWLVAGGALAFFMSQQKPKSVEQMNADERAAAEERNRARQGSLPSLVAGQSDQWTQNLPLPVKSAVYTSAMQDSWGKSTPTLEQWRAAQEEARRLGYPEGYYARQMPGTCFVKLPDGRGAYADCGLFTRTAETVVDENGTVM